MSKITIDDIKAQFASVNSINLRFKQVEDEFNNRVLYRDPTFTIGAPEPNEMLQDLDMNENDILNGGVGHFKNVFVDGLPVTGAKWGDIGGSLQDQTDLYSALTVLANGIESNELAILDNDKDIFVLKASAVDQQQDIEELFTRVNGKVADVRISIDNNTALSLAVDRTVPTIPEIVLTPQVGTKEPFTLVKLDAQGLIDNQLLPFGGAYNSKGAFTVAADPGPYDNPTIRGLGPFNNGDLYAVSMPNAQTEGTVLVNTEGVGGPEVPVVVEPGDALVYLDDLVTPALSGWYAVLSQGAGDTVAADEVAYDPTGNRIIQPASVNVDAALTDLDNAVVKRSGDTMSGNLTVDVPVESLVLLRSEGVDARLVNTGGILHLQGPPGGAVRYSAMGGLTALNHEFRGPVLGDTNPSAINHLTRKDYVDGIRDTIYEALFPVGAVHVHPNPNGVIPGTWVQLAEGTFLMNTVAAADPVGGENFTTLAEANLPSHTHPGTFTGTALPGHTHKYPIGAAIGGGIAAAGSGEFTTNPNTTSVSAGTPAGSIAVNANSAHVSTPLDNRPVFKGVAIWERTA